eukprot:TRINITY_DN1308_c0_g1_i11.p1 TRINITY_DN1308_c0_g1~~TRINITY_DN1308_c0_g1_i11.p1  ORF type:complete len:278 (+),score=55.19 TRINITY_DN1308_c0_g1_i11:3-836(+)
MCIRDRYQRRVHGENHIIQMAEQEAKQQQFQHISSLIVQREQRSGKSDEPTGEPETLTGKIDPKRMGDRAQTSTKPKKPQQQVQKPTQKKAQNLYNPKKTTKINVDTRQSVVDVEIQEKLVYRPKTRENRLIYEQILNIIHGLLGDETGETLRSVADEIIAVLKMEGIKDYDKKTEIEGMIGKIAPELFSTLLNLSKQITDYSADQDQNVDDDEISVALEMDQDQRFDEGDEGEDDEQFQQEEYREGDDDDEREEETEEKEQQVLRRTEKELSLIHI